METIKPRFTWVEANEQMSSQSGHAQAVELDLVQIQRGTIFNSWIEPELYVRKEIHCGKRRVRANTKREYTILRKLAHPHILEYADFEYIGKIAHLYTKYCDQGDLGLFLPGRDKAGQFTETHAWDVARQISSALMYIHHGINVLLDSNGQYSQLELAAWFDSDLSETETQSGGYLHRDIKPENIFISQISKNNIVVRLGDFGLAKEFREGLTQSYVGTIDYIAPECRRIAYPRQVGPKSDIWAFGQSLQNLTSHTDNISADFKRIISGCMKQDLTERSSTLNLLESLASPKQRPLLHTAILEYSTGKHELLDVELIDHLLEIGVSIDQRGNDGETAMHLVSWGGVTPGSDLSDVANLLKTRGADLSASDNHNLTPLDWEQSSQCASRRNLQTRTGMSLPRKLALRGDIILTEPWQKSMPLVLAAASGNVGMLRLILEYNPISLMQLRVLSVLAAHFGHSSCLQLLRGKLQHRMLNAGTAQSQRNLGTHIDEFHKAILELLLTTGRDDDYTNERLFDVIPEFWTDTSTSSSLMKLTFEILLETSGLGSDAREKYSRTKVPELAHMDYNDNLATLFLKESIPPLMPGDENFVATLVSAAKNGNEIVVKKLFDILRGSLDHDSPLIRAVKQGPGAMFELMYGASWTAPYRRRVTVFEMIFDPSRRFIDHVVARGYKPVQFRGHSDICLTEQTLSIDTIWQKPQVDLYALALVWAAHYAYEAVVKQLVEVLLEVSDVLQNPDLKEWYRPEILLVANRGCYEDLDAMLTTLETTRVGSMAGVHGKDELNRTALSWAAQKGHTDVVQLLLNKGKADPDIRDKFGRTPLSLAAENGHIGVVDLLLETGKVDVDSRDWCYRTPLLWAVKKGHNVVVERLLDTACNATTDTQDIFGMTPMRYARARRRESIVRLLNIVQHSRKKEAKKAKKAAKRNKTPHNSSNNEGLVEGGAGRLGGAQFEKAIEYSTTFYHNLYE